MTSSRKSVPIGRGILAAVGLFGVSFLAGSRLPGRPAPEVPALESGGRSVALAPGVWTRGTVKTLRIGARPADDAVDLTLADGTVATVRDARFVALQGLAPGDRLRFAYDDQGRLVAFRNP